MTNSKPLSFMSAREFVARAIAFERESAAFYQAMQDHCQAQPSVSELLRLLANEELKHAGKLTQFKIAEPEAIIQFPPDLSASMPPAPAEEVELAELIELGIKREQISQHMYQHAAQTVTGSFQELLEGLARFEEEHEQRLKSMRAL